MRVCIVGNGPSAKGHGTEIDACDIVIRLKAWWRFGAVDAGSKCDVWAHFACPQVQAVYENKSTPEEMQRTTDGEHWMLHTVEQMRDPKERVGFLVRMAALGVLRWVTQSCWQRARDYLDRDPSSGMVAAAMAMDVYEPTELALYGFDCTTPDQPNFENARIRQLPCDHDFVAEKRALAEIHEGRWLGEAVETGLVWPDEPVLCER